METSLKKKNPLLVLPEMLFFFILKYRSVCFVFFKSHFFSLSCSDSFPPASPHYCEEVLHGIPHFFFFFFPWVGRSVVSQISLLYLSSHFVLSFSVHHQVFYFLPCICISQCIYFISSLLRPRSID